MKRFICSDIHGFYIPFIQALNEAGFDKDNPEHILIICGDMFDRGQYAPELFDYIKSLDGNRFVYIYGNHEQLLLNCLDALYDYEDIYGRYFRNSTVDTICQISGIVKEDFERAEYNVYQLKIKTKPLYNFIKNNTVRYYEFGDYICTHGWLPVVDDKVPQNWKDCDYLKFEKCVWLNWEDMARKKATVKGKTIICGHYASMFGHKKENPLEENYSPYYADGFIAIDSCVAVSGKINVLVFED